MLPCNDGAKIIKKMIWRTKNVLNFKEKCFLTYFSCAKDKKSASRGHFIAVVRAHWCRREALFLT